MQVLNHGHAFVVFAEIFRAKDLTIGFVLESDMHLLSLLIGSNCPLGIPVVVLEELTGVHEVELWVILEQSSGKLVSLHFNLLGLLLLFKFLSLFSSQLRSELLIALFCETTLAGIFRFHELVLDPAFAFDTLLVFIDPDLPLRSYFVLVYLAEFVFTLNEG